MAERRRYRMNANVFRCTMTGVRTILLVILIAVTTLEIGSARETGTAPFGQTTRPTIANIAYAPPDPAGSRGHLLDLYLPAAGVKPIPVVIWTGGSGWKGDNDKAKAGEVAAQLNRAGLAVAGVSIRSSAQTTFPGQLYDIKAAIRWLRANAAKYDLDPNQIGYMGGSSGGWAAVMAAVTGDRPELEGNVVSALGVSSAIQAAVAFSPTADLLSMDGANYYSATWPIGRLLGCAPYTCPEKARAASPAQYITGKEPPIMILHGELDQKVTHNQSELLYEGLKEACDEAVFISLPSAGHGPSNAFLTNDALRKGATIRSVSSADCKAKNAISFTPGWRTVTDFFKQHLGVESPTGSLPSSAAGG